MLERIVPRERHECRIRIQGPRKSIGTTFQQKTKSKVEKLYLPMEFGLKPLQILLNSRIDDVILSEDWTDPQKRISVWKPIFRAFIHATTVLLREIYFWRYTEKCHSWGFFWHFWFLLISRKRIIHTNLWYSIWKLIFCFTNAVWIIHLALRTVELFSKNLKTAFFRKWLYIFRGPNEDEEEFWFENKSHHA